MTWITNRFFSWCEIGIKTMILLLLLMDTGAVRAQRNELVMATTFSYWIRQKLTSPCRKIKGDMYSILRYHVVVMGILTYRNASQQSMGILL